MMAAATSSIETLSAHGQRPHMNSWLDKLKGRFGKAPVAAINYSMPTISADPLEFVEPTVESFRGAPQFHEDEWAQLEFLQGERLDAARLELKAYKGFELTHRLANGWRAIYTRKLARDVLIAGPDGVATLAALFNVPAGNAPILLTSSAPLGQVAKGFSLPITHDVTLYGLAGEQGISVLAAMVRAGGNDQHLTEAFVRLNRAYGLLLVDWRGQLLLSGAGEDGKIEGWRP